jgi:N-acetylglutamate synthase-like GNAT family acetyltransferase
VRAARPEDDDRLRELTFESKSHWGYDHDLVRRWADELSFSDRERWVAESDGELLGWAGLLPPSEGIAVLDHLWIGPSCHCRGIGSRLFRLAADRARELGAARMEWGAEPNAVGFYEKVGGRSLRDHVSEWGRVTPWMGLDL